MGIYSFISSQFVRMNKKWTRKVEDNLAFLKMNATAIVTMSLHDKCEDILKTPTIEESSIVIFAALAQAALMINRGMGTGKFNAARQIAFEKYRVCGRLMDIIDEEVFESEEVRRYVMAMVSEDLSAEEALVIQLANWAIRRLCHLEPTAYIDDNHREAVIFLSSNMLTLGGTFPRR